MNVLIYGAGVLGVQVYHLIHEIPEFNISGFIDDTKKIGESIFPDHKVTENRETLEKKMSKEPQFTKDYGLILAIGPDNLAARWKVFQWGLEKGFHFPNLIHPRASVDASASLSKGNIILANATIDHDVSIGDANYLDIGCLVSHNGTIGNNNFLTTGCATAGNVKFGNHNFVGMHSTFTDYVEVGDENYFSAKNLVNRNVSDRRKILTFLDQKSLPI
jgi:sugar O-acyltransferase (sialic acid O-acetyltransferase NeuD family)